MMGVDKVRLVISIIGEFFFFLGVSRFGLHFFLCYREKFKAGRENLRFYSGVFTVF